MLGTCNASHTTCKASNLQRISSGLVTPQFIPKRLLHISGDCEPLQVRLYETTSSKAFLEGVSVRYTALSHCWGSTPVIKTTTDTVSGFKTAGINWLLMPKTFQEAMMLTRALGINYIWIDSLCKYIRSLRSFIACTEFNYYGRYLTRLGERLGP